MTTRRIFGIIVVLLSISTLGLKAQISFSSMEFLQHNPDTRSAGMGNAYLGSGKGMYLYADPTAFERSENRLYSSYSLTMLPKGVDGRLLFHAFSAGYKFLPNWSVMAGFRTQAGWNVPLINNNGMEIGSVKPNNWSIDLGSTVGFYENWVGFVRGSYIHSYQGTNASSIALSLGFNYTNHFSILNLPFQYSLTAAMTNFGWGLKYGEERKEVGLPTAAELGGSMDMYLSDDHKIVFAGIFGCELRPSITNRVFGGVGLEYGFMNYASLRLGYHHRNNLNTYSIGLGGQYKFASVDLAYLMTKQSEFNQFRLGVNIAF